MIKSMYREFVESVRSHRGHPDSSRTSFSTVFDVTASIVCDELRASELCPLSRYTDQPVVSLAAAFRDELCSALSGRILYRVRNPGTT